MPVCPSGHTSAADDYCDVCGDLMEGPRAGHPGPAPVQGAARAAPRRGASGGSSGGGSEAAAEVCPRCGSPRSGRFCEVDGHDFATGGAHTVELSAVRAAAQGAAEAEWRVPSTGGGRAEGGGTVPGPVPSPPAPVSGWSALIRADRDYYNSVIALEGPDSTALTFPPYCPERRVPLLGAQVRIGRRSTSRAIFPEIDLGTPPEDPGVSHLHAVLLAQPDGTWTLVDPGSTNGTTVNGGTEPIAVNVPVPMRDGDRIHVGAWTTITLSVTEGPP